MNGNSIEHSERFRVKFEREKIFQEHLSAFIIFIKEGNAVYCES